MPIPGPGTAISMNTIAGEFGGDVPHSLSEYYRGGGRVPDVAANAAVAATGSISIGSFYGARNRSVVNLVISGNTYNYDVYSNAVASPSYVAGISDVVVTVDPGVAVGSTWTAAYAMSVPGSFSPADTVTIVNNGTIIGTGGNGGDSASPGVVGTPGFNGGNALYANRPVVITNNGTIAGGGGGGGGGIVTRGPRPKIGGPAPTRPGGGGGGGAGFNAGGGGGSPTNPGSPGTLTSGGAGGATPFNPGGAGGGQGAAGSASPGGIGGGSAGHYIVGNPFVTWPATGTRLGNVA